MKNRFQIIIILFAIAISVFFLLERNIIQFRKLLASLDVFQEAEVISNGGFGNSFEMSPDGSLALSFIDNEGKLIFVEKVEKKWQTEVVALDALAGNETSLAFDKKGEPNILYVDQDFSLKLAKRLGYNNWESEKIFDKVALSVNLIFDKDGNPNISFWSTSKGTLMFGKKTEGMWQIEIIDSGEVGWWNSLALDADQNPHISYYDFKNGDLLYVFFNGEKWQKEVIDFEGDVGRFNSMVLGPNNQPHISYFNQTNSCLKYATKEGDGWRIETIDRQGGEKTNIVLNKNKEPIISFVENKNFKIAKKINDYWEIKKIDSGLIEDNSVLFDDKGNIHLLWYDLSQKRLKYLTFPFF